MKYISKSNNYNKNPGFGLTYGRHYFNNRNEFSRFWLYFFIKKDNTIVADLDIPAAQCTKIFFFYFIEFSINSNAYENTSIIFECILSWISKKIY